MNLASRLENVASSGSICISEETYLLVDTFFKFKEPKEIDVKGYLRKIRYFELDRAVNKRTEHILKMNSGFFRNGIELAINERESTRLRTFLNLEMSNI